jgi:uncharacterized protein YyaL (SSP411 family)
MNRLARQKSPYLLQHQHNPVDWRPWDEEAFAEARRADKPIFVSIGYSTCHWCHVMERESFEDEKVASFLNAHFVSIKVDREERPDVDRIYMTFVQATSGHGGWPLNVFLTPDLKPFLGGTYFPPDSRHGQTSFLDVLEQVHRSWQTRRAGLTQYAAQIQARLQEATARPPSGLRPTETTLRRAGQLLKETYDPLHGGFGHAPKFPHPSQPRFLLRYAKRFQDTEALRMVLHTCDRMAAGGIHDQLGGGFARYSVDAEWRVPHFEKMLYDNAQLAELYLDAALVSGQERYAGVARDILAYVLRDMTHPQGGFYSAEDADSEGHEGKFYCWTRRELAELLTPDEFEAAVLFFGVTEQGNFLDHSHPSPLPNQNVLSVVEPDLTGPGQALLASARKKMSEARARRIRPHLDDKVLASWNGLMLGAFARAYAVLGDPAYLAAAEKNLAFLEARLWDANTLTLYHRWRDGERDNVQLLTGYAFVLAGVLSFYQATLVPSHLDFALALAQTLLARFFDPKNGGFWQSASDAAGLIARVKEDYDGAEPGGNSVAALALLELGKITGRPEFTTAAHKTLDLFAEHLEQLPQAVPSLLHALDFSLDEPRRFVLADPSADPANPQRRALLRALHSVYQPNKVVLGNAGAVEPFARTLPPGQGAVLYPCTGSACQEPTSDPERIKQMAD